MPAGVQGMFECSVTHHNQRLVPVDLLSAAEIEVHISLNDKKLFIKTSYAQGRYVQSMIKRDVDLAINFLISYTK